MHCKIACHLLNARLPYAILDGIRIHRRSINRRIRRDAAIHAGEKHNAPPALLRHALAHNACEREGGGEVTVIGAIKILHREIIEALGRGGIRHHHQAVRHAACGALILHKGFHRHGFRRVERGRRDR